MKQDNSKLLAIVWLMLLIVITASVFTLFASGGGMSGRRWISSSDYEILERYSRLETVRRELEQNYVVELDDEALMTGALRGMMASVGDRYTFYYTPEELMERTSEAEGEFSGIGIVIINNAQGYIEIVRVHENTPAQEAGLKVGDLLVAVDGTPVSGASYQTMDEAVALVQGETGTDVVVTVLRDGEKLDLTAMRSDLSVSNVRTSMLPGEIGYIDLYQFSGDAAIAFDAAISNFEIQGARGLVIDLRNNPGGNLDQVLTIADRLLPEGLIMYMEDRSGAREDHYSDAACSELPLAILINGSSASASEVLAGAVQDHDRGTIVGSQSYGKGIVQTVVTFPDDGAGMQYTSAFYYTPSGQNIHGTGIAPDVVVEAEYDFAGYSGEANMETDAQLRAAVAAVEARIAGE